MLRGRNATNLQAAAGHDTEMHYCIHDSLV